MSGGVGGGLGGVNELYPAEFCLGSNTSGGATQGATEQLEEDVFGSLPQHGAVERG